MKQACFRYYLHIKFCLATIGVCVFRCDGSGCRTFLFCRTERKEYIMRTAAKVFIVLSMILLCWTIVPLIVGICAFVQLNDETRKPTTAMSVVTLLFCNLIAGILMLCIEEPYYRKRTSPSNRCADCGIYNLNVNLYPVNTYLGPVTKNLCPQCKQKYDMQGMSASSSQYNSMQCVKCGAYNSRVKQYKVRTPLGFLNQNLCIKCKEENDILEQNQNENTNR